MEEWMEYMGEVWETYRILLYELRELDPDYPVIIEPVWNTPGDGDFTLVYPDFDW